MRIGGCDTDREIVLIAEIGNNHEGDPVIARRMVEEAACAGAQAVKVQIIDPERLVHCSQTQRIAQLRRFRLPESVVFELAGLARSLGLIFVASVFDLDSLAKFVHVLDAVKIASGDLDFHPLLRAAAGTGKPVILSTGMSEMEEIRAAVKVLVAALPSGRSAEQSLALLHCVSLYPAPLAEANIGFVRTLRKTFGLTTGYSDHTLGLEAACAAMTVGARILEKHFTLDKNRSTFRDHALSADPAELQRLASLGRGFAALVGDGTKHLCSAEVEMARLARRSVVAARDLPAGTTLTADCLDFIRPRAGLSPATAESLIGRKTRAALQRHETILWEHLTEARDSTPCAASPDTLV